MRTETRKERQSKKTPIFMPVSVALVNFGQDANIAFAIRSAACFGVQNVYIIGNSTLKRETLNDLSGTTLDLVNIAHFSTPMDFVEYGRKQKISFTSMELIKDQEHWLDEYNFMFNIVPEHISEICIAVGHETAGVPVEVLRNSEVVAIRMPGYGFCLNTSQTVNIALYEAAKQWSAHVKRNHKI